MNQPGKPLHSQKELDPADSPTEEHAKPSQAEGERKDPQPGEEQPVANPQVQAETPPKPSQAEGD